jgi:hypothetical protein
MELTTEQLNAIKNRQIRKAILNDGSKVRLFMSRDGILCRYYKGSSRYGTQLMMSDIKSLVEPKKEKSPDEKTYGIIAKFRKEALKATFTNDFIKDCLALPDSFEKWVEEGKKSPYEYGITTGCLITGKLIKVETIADKMKDYDRNAMMEALKNKTDFNSGRFKFYGYDGSVSFEKRNDGSWMGFFNKEYRNCGNGYYYILINDDYFIGYDID